MAPPTFESNRSEDSFTARLLLHHFLSEDDIEWLSQFDAESLSDSQKRALIFLREVGAIDNPTFRQLSDLDVLKASGELRSLRDKELIQQKGKGRSTYYVPGPTFTHNSAPVRSDSTPVDKTGSKQVKGHSAPAKHDDSAPARDDSAPVVLKEKLPQQVKEYLEDIGSRATKKQMYLFLLSACRWKDMSLQEMSTILDRDSKYILRKYIQPLMNEGKLAYTIPDMPNHPRQTYTITGTGKKYLKSEE